MDPKQRIRCSKLLAFPAFGPERCEVDVNQFAESVRVVSDGARATTPQSPYDLVVYEGVVEPLEQLLLSQRSFTISSTSDRRTGLRAFIENAFLLVPRQQRLRLVGDLRCHNFKWSKEQGKGKDVPLARDLPGRGV
ncbi:MAG: hypothetical protein ABIR39_18305 [Nocardioides sp.]|uniref:hypothetical protein n=1 Tax=Nocardioides sp. TaxID=35761 RepID=UPI003263F34E